MYVDDQSGSVAAGHSVAWTIVLSRVCCFSQSQHSAWDESWGCLGLPGSTGSALVMAGTCRLRVLPLPAHLTRGHV